MYATLVLLLSPDFRSFPSRGNSWSVAKSDDETGFCSSRGICKDAEEMIPSCRTWKEPDPLLHSWNPELLPPWTTEQDSKEGRFSGWPALASNPTVISLSLVYRASSRTDFKATEKPCLKTQTEKKGKRKWG